MNRVSDKTSSRIMEEALGLEKDLQRWMLSRTRNRADAEEIVQETYLRFQNRLSRGEQMIKGEIRPYVFRIASNLLKNYYGGRKREAQPLPEQVAATRTHTPTRGEYLEYCKESLGVTQFEVLEALLQQIGEEGSVLSSIYCASEKELVGFRERLSALYNKYSIEGNFVLPPEIGEIQFNPLSIKFRKNRFGGNPLSFFQKHKAFYGRMSKWDLARADETLYNALRKQGQITKAIPVDRRPLNRRVLSRDETQAMLRAYKSTRGNARAAARSLNYNARLILQCWKDHDLEVRNRGSLLSSERRAIIEAYVKHDGVVSRAAHALGYSRQTVTETWREEGLEVDPRRGLKVMEVMLRRDRFSGREQKRIERAYSKCEGVITRAARLTGHAPKTVKKYWTRQGLL